MAAPAGASTSPAKLYQALLTTSFKGLPSGFYSAEVGTDDLDAKDKRHHAIGAVIVTVGGEAAISYVVYPTKEDVAQRFREKPSTDDSQVKSFRVVGKVPSYWYTRSQWINATLEGKNAFGKTVRNGATIVVVQRRNVIVTALTISTDNEQSGDVPGALRLLKAGIAHVDRLAG